MNLALLNPFRQADRIDSTLTIPRALHPPRPKPDRSTKTQTTSDVATTTDDSSKKKSDDKVTTTNTSTSTTQTTTATNNNGDTPLNQLGTSTTAAEKSVNTEQQNKEPSQNESTGGNTVIKPSIQEGKISTSTSMDIDTKESNVSTSSMDIEMKDSNLSEKSTTLKPPTKEKPLTQKKKRKKKTKQSSFDESDSDDDDTDNTYWTACYTVSFNRRGSLLSSGHASGLIPIHDFLGRTMSALYYPPPPIRLTNSMNNGGSLVTPSIREGGSLLTSFMYEISANKKKRKGWSKKKLPQLPTSTKKNNDVEQQERTAAVALSGDGTLDNKQDANKEEESDSQVQYVNGVTSLSWDRRSRTLLAGAIGDKNLRLMDNTHPLVSTDCTDAVKRQYLEEHSSKELIKKVEKIQTTFEEKKTKVTARSPPVMVELNTPDNGNIPIQIKTVSIGRARLLKSKVVDINTIPKKKSLMKQISSTAVVDKSEIINIPARRYSTLLLELPQPSGGPVQLHPHDDSHTGLACMIDGSLGLFLIPHLAYYETLTSADTGIVEVDERKKSIMKLLKDEDLSRVGTLGYIVSPPQASNANYFITCAAFGKHGDIVWAVTKCGNLLAYAVDQSMMNVLRDEGDITSPTAIDFANQKIKPKLCVKVPGSAAAWQIIISRNGKHLLINSADCSLRLYSIEELTEAFDKDITDDIEPCFSFQDNITKCPWASCDFSGDGEYVIGGCNSYPQPGDNYKIFLWSTHTGELADQLTGPVSSLYSLSCHPTRPFIAVGTCDGIIDVWGTRLDWSAFAPNFQRLQQNEVYEEAEDEFDVVVDGDNSSKGGSDLNQVSPEDDVVDITTVSKVPAFDSDSEEEEEIFHFDWRAERIVLPETRGRRDPI